MASNSEGALREALTDALLLMEEEFQLLSDNYMILYKKDPDYGKLTPEGEAICAPWRRAIMKAKRALAA